jgi:predicted nucleotidyltransferase component of viral defense system
MIPQAYITEWRNKAPWPDDAQVEQDLVIERALIEIYSDPFLKERLAFRGGTALHKLHLPLQARYSEDIDLVQITAEPFGPVIDRLRDSLTFLGRPVRKQKQHNNTLVFRFESEQGIPMKLKVEVNCREHFTVLSIKEMPVIVNSQWYKGSASIPTYDIHELLGTKLRALYQRKKGRDLFDMWYAMTQTGADGAKIINIWEKYMAEERHSVSQAEFLNNMDKKINEKEFIGDTEGLLRSGINYNSQIAYEYVREFLLTNI